MLRLRLVGFIFAFNLNFNFIFAGNVIPFPITTIDSFPALFLDSLHLRFKDHWDISLSPLSNVPLFNPIDGFLVQTGFTTRFNGSKPVEFSLRPRYAINRKSFYAVADFSSFIYKDGFNSTQFLFSGGNFLQQVNQPFLKNEQIISIINVLDGINRLLFIEKKFFKIQITQILHSKFKLSLASEFADRTYLENHSFQRLNFSPNDPYKPFNLKDKSFINTFSITYFPFLIVTYKKGISGFLKSESNFDYLELVLSQSFKIKDFGRIDLNVTSGKYFEPKFIHFNDFYHFPTGRTLKTNHPVISTFRLLPYYEFSTNNYFHRIHVQAQMSNFLFSRLTLLKKSNIPENLFFNLAVTDTLQPFIEMGYAVDNILKNFRLEIVTGILDGKWLGPRIILGPTSL
jgi:hypothetical protein